MRVAVVAEFYPRAADPVLGIWAHRQALAVRDAGAELTVFVLHRLVPPTADFSPRALRSLLLTRPPVQAERPLSRQSVARPTNRPRPPPAL